MSSLILIRHGQSLWNAANRFTGWTDIDLSPEGEEEAAEAGMKLAGNLIDRVHTSDLIRAQRTAEIILKLNEASGDVPLRYDARLNLSLIHI